MKSSTRIRRAALSSAFTLALTAGCASSALAAEVPELDLKFGVLVGLSGDLAQSGQPWLEAARVGVEDLKARVEAMGYADKVKISFVGGEDSQGNAQGGIEAAKKLVGVNGANVVIGDFFSSVTVAAAQSVFIPEQIIDFTGGTAPSITDLNQKTGATWMWRMAPPDSIQGPVVAKVMAEALGADKTINVAARNDTYGVGLVDAFKTAWEAGGGKIGADRSSTTPMRRPSTPRRSSLPRAIRTAGSSSRSAATGASSRARCREAARGIRRRLLAATRSAVARSRTRRWPACATRAAT